MKYLLILLVLLSVSASMPYAMKCPKCVEEKAISIGIAHRNFEKAVVTKDGHDYAEYKCQYGHVFYMIIK